MVYNLYDIDRSQMINQYAQIKMSHSYNGILLSNKKEGITDICNHVDESQKLSKTVEQKKLDTEEHILYDSIYTMFFNRQNSSKMKAI